MLVENCSSTKHNLSNIFFVYNYSQWRPQAPAENVYDCCLSIRHFRANRADQQLQHEHMKQLNKEFILSR